MAHIKQLTCMDGRPVEVDFARLIETRSEQRGATLVLTTDGLRVGRETIHVRETPNEIHQLHIQGRQVQPQPGPPSPGIPPAPGTRHPPFHWPKFQKGGGRDWGRQ
jgi:hypothetical protein